jgi:hypothetical protein
VTIVFRLIINPKTHHEYPLRNGDKFVIDNYRDSILKNGYAHMPPKRKSLWKKTVKDLIDNEFKGNIAKASEVLYEVYQKPEYLRGNLYKYVYTRPRQDKQNKKKEEILKRIHEENLADEVLKELLKERCIGVESEKLGTEQCDYQLRTLRTRVGFKALVKALEGK